MPLESIRENPVAILGAGTIGAAWAAFFSLAGLEVRVADPDDGAQACLDEMRRRAEPVMRQLGTLLDAPTVPSLHRNIADAVRDTRAVQEALPENLELKRAALREAEAVLPADALIMSSSSGLLPSALQQDLKHPERLLIAHPCNPAYLMPLVELVPGEHTGRAAMDRAETFYQALGKKTVRLKREATGHLVNRLQAALYREAVHLVAEGYADIADVDRAVTEGLGARWTICGPHMIFHLSGGPDGMAGFLDKLGPAMEHWWSALGNPQLDGATCQTLIEQMADATEGRNREELAAARDQHMLRVLGLDQTPRKH